MEKALVKVNWATDEELRTKKGIVYRIVNLVNGKSYIGMTLRTFYKRYGIKWYRRIQSPYLKESIKKHGPEIFKIQILISGFLSNEALLFWEIFFGEYYNSYRPNGYNLIKCGRKIPDRRFLKSDKKNNPEIVFYCLRNPKDDKLVLFSNIAKFCREQNLDDSGVGQVLNGNIQHSNFWTLPSMNKYKLKIGAAKPFYVKTIFGDKVYIQNLASFCKENYLCYHAMKRLRAGKVRKYSIYINPNGKIKEFKRKYYHFYKDGQLVSTSKLHIFCKENNLQPNCMSKVAKGKQRVHKGYSKANI